MSAARKSTPDPYARFLAERESILEHKWYLSEQLGKDIGFERALADWVSYHRDQWLEEQSATRKPAK